MHFNTKITGRDVPQTEEEWEALDADQLAVLLNRDGMLKYDGKVRSLYISNHIRMVQTNVAIERVEQQEVEVQIPTIHVANDPEYWMWRHEQARKKLGPPPSLLNGHLDDEPGDESGEPGTIPDVGGQEGSDDDLGI